MRVAAWFAYSIILFALHGDDFGIFKVEQSNHFANINLIQMILFAKVLPIFAAIASFAPFLGVIHWAKVINPAYRGTPKKVTTIYTASRTSTAIVELSENCPQILFSMNNMGQFVPKFITETSFI